jgi:hypothetical protein
MKDLLLLCLLTVASCSREGSGYFSDDSDDFSFEGSGEGDHLILQPDDQMEEEQQAGIHFDQKTSSWDSYDKKYNLYAGFDDDDDMDDYIYSDDEYDDDGDLTLKVDTERESVLKIVPEIEIKPKPSLIETEYALDTSHILIMIGSAFVSFGVIMLTFFLCKRSIEQKQEKINSVASKKEKFEPSPIVKDYQRVPTDMKEYLEKKDETHIEMYKGDAVNQEAQTTSEPLIS